MFRYEKEIKTLDSFRLLLVEMLYGDEIFKISLSVNYHQFSLASNNVLFFNIANMTLMSLWAVARTAFL
jgi:hypothetical protein